MEYVGIDVHKKKSQMCLVLRCRNRRLRNACRSGDATPHESLGRMSKVCYGIFSEALCERPAMSIDRPGRVPTTVPGCVRRTRERRT